MVPDEDLRLVLPYVFDRLSDRLQEAWINLGMGFRQFVTVDSELVRPKLNIVESLCIFGDR